MPTVTFFRLEEANLPFLAMLCGVTPPPKEYAGMTARRYRAARRARRRWIDAMKKAIR